MKVAVITDTHLGVKGDAAVLLDHQERFFRETFFPKLDELGITEVLHGGDVFDRRKYVNFVTLKRAREMLFEPLASRGVRMRIIAGNHDVAFRDTNGVNSLDLLLREYPNIEAHTRAPVELSLGSTRFMLAPWITRDNEAESLRAIAFSKADVLLGHLGITGFEMDRGRLAEEGLDGKLFAGFESVWSGHFHHPSERDNIKYLGAPYEMTWIDYDGVRGFHVFDTETRELTLVRNPRRLFHKLHYDDSDLTVAELGALDVTPLQDSFVKLIVRSKSNPYVFDLFVERLQEIVTDLKIVEDSLSLEDIPADEELEGAKDTLELICEYVEANEFERKAELKELMSDLYAEVTYLSASA